MAVGIFNGAKVTTFSDMAKPAAPTRLAGEGAMQGFHPPQLLFPRRRGFLFSSWRIFRTKKTGKAKYGVPRTQICHSRPANMPQALEKRAAGVLPMRAPITGKRAGSRENARLSSFARTPFGAFAPFSELRHRGADDLGMPHLAENQRFGCLERSQALQLQLLQFFFLRHAISLYIYITTYILSIYIV